MDIEPTRNAKDADVIAAFDFDKTLSTRDCVVPFLLRFATLGTISSSFFDTLPMTTALLRGDRDSMKEIVTKRFLAGVNRSHIEQEARKFADFVNTHWLRTDTVSMMNQHREAGHRVVIVSASYGEYLRPLGQALGAEEIIATELEYGPDSKATGRIAGRNCRGAEKARRMRSWIDLSGITDFVLYAYGDSAGDRELLAMADHPRRVGKREFQ